MTEPSHKQQAPIFVAPQMLRTPMRDLFPEQPHLAEHFDEVLTKLQRNARRRRAATIFGNIVFYGIVLGSGGWLLSQALDRDVPIRATVEITTPHVRPGESLAMRVTPFRYRICETKVTFVIRDGQGRLTSIETDWQQPKGPVGADRPFVRLLRLPFDAEPGDAYLRILREFRCPLNFFQQRWPITDISPEMQFKILPRSR